MQTELEVCKKEDKNSQTEIEDYEKEEKGRELVYNDLYEWIFCGFFVGFVQDFVELNSIMQKQNFSL